MENIERVADYAINKSIDYAEENQNSAFLLDFNTLLRILVMVESVYMKYYHEPLFKEDFYETQYGLSIKDSDNLTDHPRKNNAIQSLALRLVVYLSDHNGRDVYDKRPFKEELDKRLASIVDDIVKRFSFLREDDFKRMFNTILKVNRRDELLDLRKIGKDDIENMIIPSTDNELNELPKL